MQAADDFMGLVSGVKPSETRMRPRTFVLFGPKAAGKTVHLSVMIRGAADQDFDYQVAIVEPHRDRTFKIVDNHYQMVSSKKWPQGTSFSSESVAENTFHVEFLVEQGTNTYRYPVQTADVGGEITKHSDPNDPLHQQLKAEILHHYAHSDGIMLYVPAALGEDQQTGEYKLQVDILLDLLHRMGKTDIPILVLLSQWDVDHPNLGPKCTAGDEAEAEHFFQTRYPMLRKALVKICPNIKVCPVSSTGPLQNGLPPKPLKPFNIGPPIRWLLGASDLVIAGRAKTRLARRALAGAAVVLLAATTLMGVKTIQHFRTLGEADRLMDRRFDGSPLGEAIARIEAILAQETHPLGPYDPWLARAKSRLVGYRDMYEEDLKRVLANVPGRVDNLKLPEVDRLIALATDYDSAFRPGDLVPLPSLVGPLGRRQKFLRQEEAFQTIATAAATLAATEDIAAVGRLRSEFAGFLQRYPEAAPGRLDQVRRAVADAGDQEAWLRILLTMKSDPRALAALAFKVDEHLAKEEFHLNRPSAEWMRGLLAVARRETDSLERFKVVTNALATRSDPTATAAACLAQAAFVDADDLAYNRAMAYAVDASTAEVEYHRYLMTEVHGNRFQRHADIARENWDRRVYEPAWTEVASAFAESNGARQACGRYIQSACPDKKMVSQVNRYIQWYDRMTEGSDVSIRVTSIFISANSDLAAWLGSTGSARVSLSVGGRAGQTADSQFTENQMKTTVQTLGSFPVSFKTRDFPLTLSTGNLTSNSRSATVDNIRSLNGDISVDGGRARVGLSCPEVIHPTLPAYGQ